MGDFRNVFAGNEIARNILVCTDADTFPYRFTSDTPDHPIFRDNLVWFGKREFAVIFARSMAVKGKDDWLDRGMETGLLLTNPELTETLMPRTTSPAWDLGFEPIPQEKIGCYPCPARASWPLNPGRTRRREKPLLHVAPGTKAPPASRLPITYINALSEPFTDDFEAAEPGGKPGTGDVADVGDTWHRVTDAVAAKGKHSLEFRDAEGNHPEWMPRIYYPLRYRKGTVTISFDLLLDPKMPPQLYIDPRQYTESGNAEYLSGPLIRVDSTGTVSAGAKTLAALLYAIPFLGPL